MRVLSTLLLLAAALVAPAASRGVGADAANVGPGPGRTLRAAAPATPGSYTGQGFDACDAPSTATMDAWLASPYRAIGIYFGGSNRHCAQAQLTAEWVSHQLAHWHLIPIYLGLQAPCQTLKENRIDPARAGAQGRAEADAAVTAATSLGLPRGSTFVYDMESYDPKDPACTQTVLTFLGAWTTRLHDRGYFSGFYSSLNSGVRDVVADYGSLTRPHPDYLDFARWDGNATTDNAAVPASYWTPHRRMHQYLGGHDETWGGVKINIDTDYLDVRPLPTPPFGDFDGNGWTDLVARDTSTGLLYLHRGNGANLEARRALSTARWTNYPAITRCGDFDGDGHEDLLAVNARTGTLWLYPGTGTGLAPRVQVGTGWTAMREISAVGDLTGDGRPDLVADGTSTGHLFLYPGRGTGFGARVDLGPGWNALSELAGVGDLTGDGRPDLVARDTATGILYLYPGRASGLAPRVSIGSGWNSMRDLVGVGDFDRDGHPDLTAVRRSDNALYLYRGRSGGVRSPIRLSGGWAAHGPLA